MPAFLQNIPATTLSSQVEDANKTFSRIGHVFGVGVSLAVVGILMAVVFAYANITASTTVLRVSMYLTKPVAFTVFPTSFRPLLRQYHGEPTA
jgi:flagellar biosynthesis component FlhA